MVGAVLDGSHPFTAHRTFPKGDASLWQLADFEIVRHHRDEKHETFFCVSNDGDTAMLIDLLAQSTDIRVTSASEDQITQLFQHFGDIEQSLKPKYTSPFSAAVRGHEKGRSQGITAITR